MGGGPLGKGGQGAPGTRFPPVQRRDVQLVRPNQSAGPGPRVPRQGHHHQSGRSGSFRDPRDHRPARPAGDGSRVALQQGRDLLQPFKGSAKRKDRLGLAIDSGLAQVAEDRQKWEVAQGYLEKLLKANPKDSVALQRLARALFPAEERGRGLAEAPRCQGGRQDGAHARGRAGPLLRAVW